MVEREAIAEGRLDDYWQRQKGEKDRTLFAIVAQRGSANVLYGIIESFYSKSGGIIKEFPSPAYVERCCYNPLHVTTGS